MRPTTADAGITIVVAIAAAVTILAGAAPAAGAAAQEPGLTPFQSLAAGCYLIDTGEWRPSRADDAEPGWTPPARIELTTRRGTERLERGRLLLRPVIDRPGMGSGRHMAYWATTPADSIRLVWTSGYGGVIVTLALHDDRVVGRAVRFTDEIDGRERPSAPIAGRRVACRGGDAR